MYAKLFTKILDSSIWLEDTSTRIVWITLLAAMDQDGYAHFSAIENLAARARVSIPETESAIDALMAPDENSENPDNNGRRIERVPGGFIILNAKHYRGLRTLEERRAYHRQYWHTRKLSKKKLNKKLNNSTQTQTTQPIAYAYAEAYKSDLLLPTSSTENIVKQEEDLAQSQKSGSGLEDEQAFIFLPTCNGQQYAVLKPKLTEWEECYPSVDIELTLKQIRQWLVDNPTRKKTSRGMGRFINSWLSREQDK